VTRAGRRGGPATAGGIDFQARFVAWGVCGLLAEREATPPWNWAQHTHFREIYAETGQPTDDVLVINSAGARAFVQAKQRVQQASWKRRR
jgi:hypothetical protein